MVAPAGRRWSSEPSRTRERHTRASTRGRRLPPDIRTWVWFYVVRWFEFSVFPLRLSPFRIRLSGSPCSGSRSGCQGGGVRLRDTSGSFSPPCRARERSRHRVGRVRPHPQPPPHPEGARHPARRAGRGEQGWLHELAAYGESELDCGVSIPPAPSAHVAGLRPSVLGRAETGAARRGSISPGQRVFPPLSIKTV